MTSQWRITTALGNDYAYFYKNCRVDGAHVLGPHRTDNPVVVPASVPYWSYANPTCEHLPILNAVEEHKSQIVWG